MLRRLFFDTKVGEILLDLFERLTGLAIVPVEDLADFRVRAAEARGG